MAKTSIGEGVVSILLESPEDVWFWDRRFNVFDFLELFPAGAITEVVPETHVPAPADLQLTFDTDAGFSFETDIIRGGFYLRNQSHGTRKWMSLAQVKPGDTIEIRRLTENHFSLTKVPA